MLSGAKNPADLDLNSLLKKSKIDLIKIILAQQSIQVPASIFSSRLHPLQAVVKYLKDDKNLRFRAIALMLNRNVQTIYTTYRLAGKKKSTVKSGPLIPVSAFAKKDCSILESTVYNLNTLQNYSLTEISLMLNKSIKTVWTCKKRYMIKEGLK